MTDNLIYSPFVCNIKKEKKTELFSVYKDYPPSVKDPIQIFYMLHKVPVE